MIARWVVAAGMLGMAGARGDEPGTPEVRNRVVEGSITAAGGGPVAGARIFFGPADVGLSFETEATATADAGGRFRADLSRFPWAASNVRVMALAPGFKATDRTIAAGAAAATADLTLAPQGWKETRLRLEDEAGRPVPGLTIRGTVGGASWADLTTDAEGSCRVAMAPAMPLSLAIRPEGARPISLLLSGTANEPGAITLPVLAPIRGRVVDDRGRPVPGVGVGRWLVFWGDGQPAEPLPFARGEAILSDGEGRFSIAPEIMLKGGESARIREMRKQPLVFTDATSRRIAFHAFPAMQASEPTDVTLLPTRPVRIPIAWGPIPKTPATGLSALYQIRADPARPDATFFLISRSYGPKAMPGGTAEAPVLEESLPAGSYRAEINLSDPETGELRGGATCDFVVPPGDGPLDMPCLTLDPPHFRRMAGKPAPEIEATDLDTGRPVTLADLRGKVVILDFWGHWCGPCIWNMPHLVDLQRRFEGRPLVIVALHDRSARDRAEYDRKNAMARERIWGGKDLPFRVLLDRPDPSRDADADGIGSGATIRRYGVDSFPTLLVIDHEGTLIEKVGRTKHDYLETLVKGLLDKAEAAR